MKHAGFEGRSSIQKTTLLALGAAVAGALIAGVLLALNAGALVRLAGIVVAVLTLAPLALAASGRVVLGRLDRAESGATDLYLESNLPRREAALSRPDGFRAGALRRLLARAMLGHDFLVGDEVEIRSLAEIEATLDENGCLDGMPFQPEMIPFCGRRGQVFRSIDKIYDYGRTRLMRRLPGCVLVANLRCDGAAHGGCQARCYMIWKTEWLRRPGDSAAARPAARGGRVAPTQVPAQAPDGTARRRYLCQFTELHASSQPMGKWELGKELRPLVAGNITLHTWLVGLATRYFNLVQRRRGGIAFPTLPAAPQGVTPIEPAPLAPGDKIVVRSGIEIAGTLTAKGKHRGLWFDPDQTKHCGKAHTVLARVDRIIDDAYGQMLTMKTPCILLEEVDYSGETLNFTAQHDLFFWREHWLEKQA